MADGYCWVCDRPVEGDPCPTCGTHLYEGHKPDPPERLTDEVLDTSHAMGPVVRGRSPVVVGLVVAAVVLVLVLVFQAGAGIS